MYVMKFSQQHFYSCPFKLTFLTSPSDPLDGAQRRQLIPCRPSFLGPRLPLYQLSLAFAALTKTREIGSGW